MKRTTKMTLTVEYDPEATNPESILQELANRFQSACDETTMGFIEFGSFRVTGHGVDVKFDAKEEIQWRRRHGDHFDHHGVEELIAARKPEIPWYPGW